MDKYYETIDTLQVSKALGAGLSVEAMLGEAAAAVRLQGGTICAGPSITLPTRPGRVFRIEVPKPEAPDGYEILAPDVELTSGDKLYDTLHYNGWIVCRDKEQRKDRWYARKKLAAWTGPVKLTAELLPRFRASCEAFLIDDGKGNTIQCDDCPGSSHFNDGIGCYQNGFRTSNGCPDADSHRAANAKRFLAGSKMRRVPLVRYEWMWGFTHRGTIYAVEVAPTVLGPGGYEYAEAPGRLYNSTIMFKCGEHLVHSAGIETLESGDVTALQPIAYWYKEEHNYRIHCSSKLDNVRLNND